MAPKRSRRVSGRGENANSRGQDLLHALRQLDVSPRDQIAIFKQLHRLGHLHAEFIEE